MQQPVQGHCHMARHHQEQCAILGTVGTGNVVDLHGKHAEYLVGGILQRRAHPVFGTITHAVETPFCLRRENAGGVDQQRLPGGQHLAGQGQVRRVEVFVVLGLQRIDVDDVDVIGVVDLVGVGVVQREIEVLGIDQPGQQLMHAHQEHRAVAGRTGQVGDFVQHPLGILRTGQGIGLQPDAQALGKIGKCRPCGIIQGGEQPTQFAFTSAGRPALQTPVQAKAVEVFIGDAGRPLHPRIALTDQMQLFTGTVDYPRFGVAPLAGRLQQPLDRVLVTRAGPADSIRVPFQCRGGHASVIGLQRGVGQWTKTHLPSLSQNWQ
ncbi:hypothetical protein D3C73_861150 [compost metagenome]